MHYFQIANEHPLLFEKLLAVFARCHPLGPCQEDGDVVTLRDLYTSCATFSEVETANVHPSFPLFSLRSIQNKAMYFLSSQHRKALKQA